jgi:hypothetical protein
MAADLHKKSLDYLRKIRTLFMDHANGGRRGGVSQH